MQGKRRLRTMAEIEAESVPVPFSGCWLWLGYVTDHGYPQPGAGRGGKMVYAHRLSCALSRGLTFSRKTHVHHTCEVTCCVNPDHLMPLSARAHRRLHAAIAALTRKPKEFCPHGHPYTPENTYINPRRGVRACRVCNLDCTHRRRERRRLAA